MPLITERQDSFAQIQAFIDQKKYVEAAAFKPELLKLSSEKKSEVITCLLNNALSLLSDNKVEESEILYTLASDMRGGITLSVEIYKLFNRVLNCLPNN